ncbi:T9SS type A sorting domain-containing protein [Sanyastnella coralliicola]|uniref:T9SS type A sorting domain-containing protein n=1 Tax=Sanyastnella coralliicola TaxID=3069118 RepID=UPI0027BAB218|nr:T9SS type A sorting domain-containing protein [Longitalea sp. SCSIO 12813]
MKRLTAFLTALTLTAAAWANNTDGDPVRYSVVHMNGLQVTVLDTTLASAEDLTVEQFLEMHGISAENAEIINLNEVEGMETRELDGNIWMMSSPNCADVKMERQCMKAGPNQVRIIGEPGEGEEMTITTEEVDGEIIIKKEIVNENGEVEVTEEIINLEDLENNAIHQAEMQIIILEDEDIEGENEIVIEDVEMNIQIETTIDEEGNENTIIIVNGEEVSEEEFENMDIEIMQIDDLPEGEEAIFIYEVSEEFEGTPEEVNSFVFDQERTIVLVSNVDEPEARSAEVKPTASSVTDLKFMPNPNNGQFTLQFGLEDKAKTTIEIHDMNGRVVYQENLGRFEGEYRNNIDISGEGSGVYILTVTHGKERVVERMIVQ